MRSVIELPDPAPEAAAHSRILSALIRERIGEAGGWIDFSEYMDLALYAPGLGYYSAGAAKLGPAGDFVTAPEISPLFARCLANACAPWLRADPARVILEIGAGTGTLAAELLRALDAQGAVPRRYLILEVSADLRERQRATLAALPGQPLSAVYWLEALPPEPLDVMVIANEVVDALPVSRFRVRDGRLLACGVSAVGDGFGWAERPAGPELVSTVAAITAGLGTPWPDGYTSEACLRLPAWLAAVGRVIGEGLLLVCDYGMARREYYHPQRGDGTLMCHYRHRAHDDPFRYPGLQDITGWVDFTAVARAGERAGLEVAGYTTQAHFLLDAGLTGELTAAMSGGGRTDLESVRQAKTLLLPGEMGERFKVMALARGAAAVGGFGFRDLRRQL
jgi:SAM-dependent MidA family methyltransferase